MNLPDHVYGRDGKSVRRTRFKEKDLEGAAKVRAECKPHVEFKFTAKDFPKFKKKNSDLKRLFRLKPVVASTSLDAKTVGTEIIVRLTTEWNNELTNLLHASKNSEGVYDPVLAAENAFEDYGKFKNEMKPKQEGVKLETDLTRTHYRVTFRTTQVLIQEGVKDIISDFFKDVLIDFFVTKFADWLDEGSVAVRLDLPSVIVDIFTIEPRRDFVTWAQQLMESSEMSGLESSLIDTAQKLKLKPLPQTTQVEVREAASLPGIQAFHHESQAFRHLASFVFDTIDSP